MSILLPHSLMFLLLLQVLPPPDPPRGFGAELPRTDAESPKKQPSRRPWSPKKRTYPVWIFAAFVVYILVEQREKKAQAKCRQMLAEEEESRTPYTEEDLMQDFEFKIIRNELNLFDQPQLLAEALREEAKAGWELVEKFDGNRIRLRRPTSQRAKDSGLPPDLDSYRTAALPEATREAKAAKRIRELKIWAGVMAGSAGAAILLAVATWAMQPTSGELGKFWLPGFAALAGIAAAFSAIGLIVRYFCR